MSHVSKGMNYLSAGERVKRGIASEEMIANCLNECYNWKLERSSKEEDTKGKIDYHEKTLKLIPPLTVQIKSRASGDDILYDRWEPFHGVGDPRTRPGRDQVGHTDIYICLSKDGEKIRVVKSSAIKKIISEIDAEWAEINNAFTSDRGGKAYFKSQKHPGCEYRWHEDKRSGVPKVLCFLSPSAFVEGKDIKFYDMKTKESK